MISCVEWIPRGVADPTPKRYDNSIFHQFSLEEEAAGTDAENHAIQVQKQLNVLQKQEEEEDDDDDDDESMNDEDDSKKNDSNNNGLPPELRMDEYSDDEDEDIAKRQARVARLLISNPLSDNDESDQDENMQTETSKKQADDDSDDDDDLRDVPDTREFMPLNLQGLVNMGIGGASGGAANYDYDDQEDNYYDDNDSEAQDVNISPNDAMIVVAKTEQDFASLEVHIYEELTGNLFVHHDIPLPAYPLSLAQGNTCGGGVGGGNATVAGNFIAVGTFDPGIEIWNLDILNVLEPTCILGGQQQDAIDLSLASASLSKNKKKKKKKKKKRTEPLLKPNSHTDAVMGLNWNSIHAHVLASASADRTVKLWDVTTAQVASTLCHHNDKVQSVRWHPTEATLLATGGLDGKMGMVDARSQQCIDIQLGSDVEALAWDCHESHYLTVATSNGALSCFDVRKISTSTTTAVSSNKKKKQPPTPPVWSLVAREYGGVSDLAYNPRVSGLLATCSENKTVTLWDTHYCQQVAAESNSAVVLQPPMACGNKEMGVGRLFTLAWYPSSPWLLACGGGSNELAIWDMTRDERVQARFGERTTASSQGKAQEDNKQANQGEADFEAAMAAQEQQQKVDEVALENIKATRNQHNNKKKKKKKQAAHRKGGR